MNHMLLLLNPENISIDSVFIFRANCAIRLIWPLIPVVSGQQIPL